MAKGLIEVFEKSKVLVTFSVKNADGSAFDLSAATGYTATLYVHDDGEANGTNRVDGAAMTINTPPGTDGVLTYTLTASDLEMTAATTSDVKGIWQINLTAGDASQDLWTVPREVILRRNLMVADD